MSDEKIFELERAADAARTARVQAWLELNNAQTEFVRARDAYIEKAAVADALDMAWKEAKAEFERGKQ